jgi:hypothetical protein
VHSPAIPAPITSICSSMLDPYAPRLVPRSPAPKPRVANPSVTSDIFLARTNNIARFHAIEV